MSIDHATWRAVTYPLIRRGYDAAVSGQSDAFCPFHPGTYGAEAWSLGHTIGRLPRPIRWALLVYAWLP